MIFSKEQLVDASGVVQEASRIPGLVFETDTQVERFPTWEEIKVLSTQENAYGLDQTSKVMLPKAVTELQPYNGTTVVVGVKNRGQEVFLPGKVLPDGQVGLLASPAAVRNKQHRQEKISDIEALILTKFYLEHLSDLEHEEGAANVAKIGMGVLVAAAKNPVGLHGIVHRFQDSEESLPMQMLKNSTTNNLNIPTTSGDYPVSFRVVHPAQTAGIEAYADHQFPLPDVGSSFELTAGLTKAIRDLQGRPTQLRANAAALVEPVS